MSTLKQMVGHAIESGGGEALEQFKVQAADFISARQAEASSSTQMKQRVAGMDDCAAEVLKQEQLGAQRRGRGDEHHLACGDPE